MSEQNAETVKVVTQQQTVELPVVVGSEGEKGIDITELRAKSGYITLDPGYVNSGSCLSAITFIDGEKGILRYRGIPIEDLAEKATFLEVSYLLIYGHLPTQVELEAYNEKIRKHTLLHEDIKRFYGGFPRDAHPMAILSSVVCSLSSFYQNEKHGDEDDVLDLNSRRLLAKLPTIAAYAYKKSIGHPFVYPDNSKSYCENFLHMMFSVPTEPYHADPDHVSALNLLLILHADHEQNCSTSTVRLVSSAGSNLFASIASGICALWGPRHGGANQEVVEMLEQMQKEGGNIKKYIAMAKDRNNDFRLFGFGHRVYKNFDPRAKIIKGACDKLLKKINKKDPLLELAKELEEAALNDDFFKEKKLYPNVDFYSGIIYRAMGIPVPAFPVMFALGRLPGWIAHAKELAKDPKNKIGRPRQVYVGPTVAEYVPIEKR